MENLVDPLVLCAQKRGWKDYLGGRKYDPMPYEHKRTDHYAVSRKTASELKFSAGTDELEN